MFDAVTAAFLRSAPELPGLDPADLPRMLTEHYAELVARRLRMASVDPGDLAEDDWPLSRIADAYEIITSISENDEFRRSAAFVAGTAQQILSRAGEQAAPDSIVSVLNRDRVDPAIAAAILFLAAEQYADAYEASRQIRTVGTDESYVSQLLAESIRDLTAGRLSEILARSERRPRRFRIIGGLEERGNTALLEALLTGVEVFAAEMLGEELPRKAHGRFESARAAFVKVITLASNEIEIMGEKGYGLLTTYPGPRHLASLLLAAYDSIKDSALIRLSSPPGVDGAFWEKWIKRRAQSAPFTWPNHRLAIDKGFHLPGKSAVMVLPTGAGKTTVSCIKIASTLGQGKNVVFLAPTHALVDQLTEDLQELFPEDMLGSLVSNDFDRLFATGSSLEKIEVMTPERCLALLSYAPEAFDNVGLLVFDECHLLSPTSGLRRALDSMFCVLAFNSIVPEADLLFLSAMLKNGRQFADWISSLTSRECLFVDPLWKPSRQARGVVFYNRKTIDRIKETALQVQKQEDKKAGRKAKGLRVAAKSELKAKPLSLVDLIYWSSGRGPLCTLGQLRTVA